MSTPQVQVKEKTTQTKRNSIAILTVLSILIVSSFFIHEFIPSKTLKYIKAKENHLLLKKERTIALNAIKKAAKGTVEYSNYKEKVRLTNIAWENLLVVKKEDRFLGFSNLQQFLGEFGWAFGLFLYSISCYIISCRERNSFKDIKLIHIPVIFISVFYILYTIQPYPDYPKSSYIFASFILTVFLSLIVYKLVKINSNFIFNLKENIRDLVGFVLKNTKESKDDDKWNLLDKVSKR